jgi:hypothetical protein
MEAVISGMAMIQAGMADVILAAVWSICPVLLIPYLVQDGDAAFRIRPWWIP